MAKYITKAQLVEELERGFAGSSQTTRYGIEYAWNSRGTHSSGVGYGSSLDNALEARADAARRWRRDLLALLEQRGLVRVLATTQDARRWGRIRNRVTVYRAGDEVIAVRKGQRLWRPESWDLGEQ